MVQWNNMVYNRIALAILYIFKRKGVLSLLKPIKEWMHTRKKLLSIVLLSTLLITCVLIGYLKSQKGQPTNGTEVSTGQRNEESPTPNSYSGIDISKVTQQEKELLETFLKCTDYQSEAITGIHNDSKTGNEIIQIGRNEDSVFYVVGKDKKCYCYSDTKPERFVGKLNLTHEKLMQYKDGMSVPLEDINNLRGTYLLKDYVDKVQRNKSTLNTRNRGNPLMFEINEDSKEKGKFYIGGTFDFHQGGYGGDIISLVNNNDGSFLVRYKAYDGDKYEIIKSEKTVTEATLLQNLSYILKAGESDAAYIKSTEYKWSKLIDAVMVKVLFEGVWLDGENLTWEFKDDYVIINGVKKDISIDVDNGNPRDCDDLLINNVRYGFELKDDTVNLYLIDKSKDFGTFKSNTVYKKLKRIDKQQPSKELTLNEILKILGSNYISIGTDAETGMYRVGWFEKVNNIQYQWLVDQRTGDILLDRPGFSDRLLGAISNFKPTPSSRLTYSSNSFKIGYFSSAWIKLVVSGLKRFIVNNGKMYLLTSPQLSSDDWNAILRGEQAKIDEVIYHSVVQVIKNEFNLSNKQDTLNLFSWMIADEIIEMKFVICKNSIGNYHDKIAIFEDLNGDKVCLHGSLNDSLQATFNGEGVSVFKSWLHGQNDYLNEHLNNFMLLFNGKNEYFKIYDIPEMLKNEFKSYQTTARPYSLPNKKIQLPNYIKELKDYQKDAVNALIENNWQGIFEMATGTGKTITAIEASRRYLEINKKIALIIIVPFGHLIKQWEDVLNDFGYTDVICCHKDVKIWYDSARRNIKNYNINLQETVCILSTYKTAASESFLDLIKIIKKDSFLIADECHYIGSKNNSKIMLESIQNRLGLSATPNRWFDEIGTQSIYKFFDKTIFEYSLRQAIDNENLTPYEYTPVIVHLSDDELQEYIDLTKKISRLLNIDKEVKKGSAIERFLIKRSLIISKACNKHEKLLDLLKKQCESEHISHTLIYCAPGENKQVIKEVAQLNIKVHDFVHNISLKDRNYILNLFDTKDIEVLVAIKCLDEGVDVPSTHTAYFLSSTSNPREFVQRRGRILRNFSGKTKAKVYDFIVMPPVNNIIKDENYEKAYRSIVIKELPRFVEFANNAENKYRAREIIRPFLLEWDLDYLIDMSTYEIIEELNKQYKKYEEGEWGNG